MRKGVFWQTTGFARRREWSKDKPIMIHVGFSWRLFIAPIKPKAESEYLINRNQRFVLKQSAEIKL